MLDLVITNEEDMIKDMEYLSPLGKNNHLISIVKVTFNEQLNGFYKHATTSAAKIFRILHQVGSRSACAASLCHYVPMTVFVYFLKGTDAKKFSTVF